MPDTETYLRGTIDALQQRVKELEEALKPFARIVYVLDTVDSHFIIDKDSVYDGYCRRAAQVLHK